jgi:serine/threonine-protein kinase
MASRQVTEPTPDPAQPSRLDAVADLFAEALELDDPEARTALVSALRARDPDLATLLADLVEAHFADPSFLEEPIAQQLAEVMTAQHEAALVGQRVGAWQVEAVLHHGGMGTVYRAHRMDVDFEQHAALKVIRRGLDTPALVERFAQERRLLARLEHPHIARLLDGGTTSDGLPFLVMEHVEGETIDVWCARERPSVERMLGVFTQICAAVNFAHQRLVVHQDIKPGNVLVTPGGTAKLLDFGIAELEREPTDGPAIAVSAPGGQMLTPDYASPEQFRGEAAGTATDTYALGILLYRLLTGDTPYHVPSGLAFEEMARIVEETIPVAPSVALASRGMRLPPRAADLDAIILRALRKDPAERYASVLAFADDVRHFTDGLPVDARPPTFGYRVLRFVGRHWAGVGAAAAILFLLVAGISVTRWQAGVAAEQRDVARAEAATAASAVEFLKTVLGSGDPWRDTEAAESVEDVLRLAETQLDSVLGEEPAARAYILAALGEVATGRGELERADRLTTAAVATLERTTDIGPAQAGAILLARSLTLHEDGRLQDARSFAAEAVRRLEAPGADTWEELAGALNQLGAVDVDRGDPTVAEPILRRASALYTSNGGENLLGLAAVYNNLAVALASQPDRLEEVAAIYGRAAGIVERTGASAPRLATLLMNQSGTLRLLGRAEDAEATALRAIGLFTESLGADHPSTLTAVGSLGVLYEAIGAFGQSVETVRPAIALALAALPADHPTVAYLQNVYSAAVCQMPDDALIPEGLRAAQASLETRLAAFGPEHWAVASGEAIVGHCLARSGRRDAGIAMLERAAGRLRAQRGDEQELTIRAHRWLEQAR